MTNLTYTGNLSKSYWCSKTKSIILACFTACFSFTLAVGKTWIQDNNWETTRNWNLQRLPCAGDVVKIDLVIYNYIFLALVKRRHKRWQARFTL
jgi:hypothetical protein